MAKRGILAGMLVALIMGGAACVAPPPSAGSAAAAAPVLSAWQNEMMGDLNAQRANAGLGPLVACGTLQAAADAHSQDQANMGQMTHSGSNGSNIGQRADGAGYAGWQTLGENVAYGFTSVDSVMNAWMNSPGHRANILNGAFTHVGLSEIASPSGVEYWTQDFGAAGHC
jgi:uncharacterized protein YkwD